MEDVKDRKTGEREGSIARVERKEGRYGRTREEGMRRFCRERRREKAEMRKEKNMSKEEKHG
jgi:hypothetical protein